MTLQAKIVVNLILMGVVIVLGVILHFSGRPYNPILFNLHKLIALGMIIFLSILFYRFARIGGINEVFIAYAIVAAFSVIILFISGAFLSEARMIGGMIWMHRFMTATLVLSLGAMLYRVLTY